jgi:hypothetical protein
MWIGPKRNADLTYDFIQKFLPEERASTKRIDLAGRSISSLLSLYKYDLSENKRKFIFTEFRESKYLMIIKKSNINKLKRIILLGLISPKIFPFFNCIASLVIKRWCNL